MERLASALFQRFVTVDEKPNKLDKTLGGVYLLVMVVIAIGFTVFTALSTGQNEFQLEVRDQKGFIRVMNTYIDYYKDNWIDLVFETRSLGVSGKVFVQYPESIELGGKVENTVQKRIMMLNSINKNNKEFTIPSTSPSDRIPLLYAGAYSGFYNPNYVDGQSNRKLGTYVVLNLPPTETSARLHIETRGQSYGSSEGSTEAFEFDLRNNTSYVFTGQLWLTAEPQSDGSIIVEKELRFVSIQEVIGQAQHEGDIILYFRMDRLVMYSKLGIDLIKVMGTLIAFWGGGSTTVLFAVKVIRLLLRRFCNKNKTDLPV